MEAEDNHTANLSLSSSSEQDLDLGPVCVESFGNLQLELPSASDLSDLIPSQSPFVVYTESQLDELQRFYEDLDLLRRRLMEQPHYGQPSNATDKGAPQLRHIRSRVRTVCSICQQRVGRGSKVVQSKCGHVHHGKCLKEWRRVKSNCPLCRDDI